MLDMYSQMLSMRGIPSSEAKKLTEDMLDQAIEESKKDGTYNLPQNLGDIIFGDVGTDNLTIKKIAESIRQKLPYKKEEGVRDQDVRWWWNLNDIERRMMLKQDDAARMTLILHELENSTEPSKEKAFDTATIKVRKFHPIYGDPKDTAHTKGEDRPLPYELKDRINIYIEKRAKESSGNYKAEIEKATTFNALVRKEIRTRYRRGGFE